MEWYRTYRGVWVPVHCLLLLPSLDKCRWQAVLDVPAWIVATEGSLWCARRCALGAAGVAISNAVDPRQQRQGRCRGTRNAFHVTRRIVGSAYECKRGIHLFCSGGVCLVVCPALCTWCSRGRHQQRRGPSAAAPGAVSRHTKCIPRHATHCRECI